MRRPLALFGFSYLFVLLAACRLPALVVVPCAVLLAAAFLFVLLYKKVKFRGQLAVMLSAGMLALVVLPVFNWLVAGPVRALAGQQVVARARVTQTAPGYGEGTVVATLQVLQLQEKKLVQTFQVEINGLQDVQVGEIVRLPLAFYPQQGRWATYAASKGFYVGARPAGEMEREGVSHSFFTRMRLLQYTASENIQQRLPHRLSTVAAAMSVGDKRFLQEDTTAAYRAAGLSHTLVVSGLHLSIVCSAVYAVAKLVLRRKKLAALVCLLFVLLFMAFTGFTPSVTRSGVAFLLVYLAQLLNRRADVYTSLGLAALLLCTQNPYAAKDVCLLLSFAATIGALAGGAWQGRLRLKEGAKARAPVKRAAIWFCRVWAVPLCVTAATLPVLVLFDMPVSLLSIPANVVAVPLVAPAMLGGLLMALPSLPVLNLLAQIGALVAGALLVLLEKIALFCAGVQGSMLYFGGLVAAAVLLLYPLAWLAVKSRRFVAYALAGVLLVGLAAGMHTVLNYGVVEIHLVGNADNPSLVITQNRQAAVIMRDRRAAYEIEQVFAKTGVKQCALLVDMRANPQDTTYLPGTPPQQVVLAQLEIQNQRILQPFGDVEVYIKKQGEGTLACVDVTRYKVVLATGSVNLAPYGPVDAVVAGRGSVQGAYGILLCGNTVPAWAEETSKAYTTSGSALLQIRPGKSAKIREVNGGI